MSEESQEMFDRVCTHLIQQRQKSVELGSYVYRTKSGLKCALGCFIPDDQYSEELESVPGVSLVKTLYPDFFGRIHDSLITDLMFVHDLRVVESWPQELVVVSEKHGLRKPDVLLKALEYGKDWIYEVPQQTRSV